MKNYSNLVNKHLKVYKKRWTLTIIGIISSIILFFTIGYISKYSKDIQAIDGIHIIGDYDAVFYNVKKEDAKKIENNIKVDKYGFYSLVTRFDINLGNVERPMYVYKIDEKSIDDIFYKRIDMKEGTLPKSDKEIVLNRSLKNQLGISINDKFDVDKTSYTIVGFYEAGSDYGINNLCGLTYLDTNNLDKQTNVIIKVKNRHSIAKDIEDIAKDSGIHYGDIYSRKKIHLNFFNVEDKGPRDNKGYIEFNETELGFASLYLFVLILSVLLTYGAINISLNERKKEFATLRCIGATPSKIKHLLIKESIILGLISLIPGIIVSQMIAWIITYSSSNPRIGITYEMLNGKIYFNVILNTIVFMGINIFFSILAPLRNVSKVSPINVVKDKNNLNNKARRRNSKIIRKLFGYTGELAYKNIRKNNSSFIINILTLSTILVVTICFSGYQSITDKFYQQNIDVLKDISITFYPQSGELEENMFTDEVIKENERFIKGIEALSISNEIYTSMRLQSNLILEETILNEGIKNILNISSINIKGKEGIYSHGSDIFILNDEYIDKILEDTDTNGKKIDKLGANDFIVVNTVRQTNPLTSKRVYPLNLESGEEADIYLTNKGQLDDFTDINPIKMNYVGSVETSKLISENRFNYFKNISIIASEDFYEQNKDLLKTSYNSRLNVFFDIDKNQDKDILKRKLNEYVGSNNADFIEEKSQELEYQQKNKEMNNLIYIAIGLVTLISIINLINTSIINISIREKEFKILLSIGMKKSKLKNMIFLEGIVTWFISSIIGGSISIILLYMIKYVYNNQGYISHKSIPLGIVFGCIFMLLIISIIISVVPYRRFKNIDLNNLMKEEE